MGTELAQFANKTFLSKYQYVTHDTIRHLLNFIVLT